MRIAIIGVPVDLGAARRGTDMGPSAIRYARLAESLRELGHQVVDLGNLHVPVAESRGTVGEKAKYLPEVAALCTELAGKIGAVVREGVVPLVLGGDHSIAVGTVAGVTRVFPDTGLIWIDAHGDFNTPDTSPSGNIHGMPLAALTGRGAPELVGLGSRIPIVPEDWAALVAVRDLDPMEREALRSSQVAVFTMKDIDEAGIASVMRSAIRIASGGGQRGFHVSVDLDALDPMYAPGVGTPVPGGLTYREAHLAMELVAESGWCRSLEFVEVNPILDQQNQTGRLAVELAGSALGKRIL